MQTETTVQLRLLPVLLTSTAASETALIPAPPAQPALYARQQSVAQRSMQEGLPVRYLGTMPLFAGFRVYPGQAWDWVLVNVAEDPLFHAPQGFPVPGHILAQLRQVARRGIDFDALYVAHEVTPGRVRPDAPLTLEALMPPPPATVVRLSNRLGEAAAALWTLGLLPWMPLVVLPQILGIGLGIQSLGISAWHDPVLLGALVAPGRSPAPGEPAAWFYLTHWAFNAEEPPQSRQPPQT